MDPHKDWIGVEIALPVDFNKHVVDYTLFYLLIQNRSDKKQLVVSAWNVQKGWEGRCLDLKKQKILAWKYHTDTDHDREIRKERKKALERR